MRVIEETVIDCGFGHSIMKSTVELTFIDTDTVVRLDISTAYRRLRLAETFVFLTHINNWKEKGNQVLFEWRGINHVHAVLRLQEFENTTVEKLLNGD